MKDYQPAKDLLKDRVILVTGAGQGLGRAAALAYADHGATVVLLGRTTAKLEKVYDEIVQTGGPMPAIFPIDLAAATDGDCEALAQAIRSQLGRLDGILHCAASFRLLSPLHLQELTDWQEHLRVNVTAPAALNRACKPVLKQSPDAAVILVGETHGHAPKAYWGSFAVSKAALEAYFKIQAEEWSEQPNLRINLLIPGPIHSPQRARTHPGEVKEGLPMPEDLAPQLLYLIGPDSKQVRGQIIDRSLEAGITAA